jgi:hypothetical protein
VSYYVSFEYLLDYIAARSLTREVFSDNDGNRPLDCLQDIGRQALLNFDTKVILQSSLVRFQQRNTL